MPVRAKKFEIFPVIRHTASRRIKTVAEIKSAAAKAEIVIPHPLARKFGIDDDRYAGAQLSEHFYRRGSPARVTEGGRYREKKQIRQLGIHPRAHIAYSLAAFGESVYAHVVIAEKR